PDEELDQVSQINPKNQAVVDGSKFELSTTDFDASGTIQLTTYQPNYIKYEVNTVNEALAVFSEVYYPVGWIAKMDGQEVAYIRCNYILRGLQIPPGNHIVEFVFRPNSYFIGNKIMMISSVLLLLVLLGSLGWTLRTHLAREENLEEPVIK
ncbi:MAG: YfhO family protein, partial [Bacteroidetes bacterium]|nr:YfhO family protein [Bacteroidota bacterium]